MQEKLDFIRSLFGNVDFFDAKKEVAAFCPYCENHHKKKLYINLKTDKWHCWVCDKGGQSLVPLLMKVGANKNKIDSYKTKFKSAEVIVLDNLESRFALELPSEYIPLWQDKSVILSRARNYLLSRGIKEDDWLYYKLGYCVSGRYADRVIIPSFSKDGELNFFTARSIDKESRMTYINPEVPEDYKNKIIINELNIDFKKPIVIVEGFFDLFKSVKNTIALLGSSLSLNGYLFNQLVSNKSEIYISLDPDIFVKKTLRIMEGMLKYDLDVRYVDIGSNKDPGGMNKEDFELCIKNSIQVDRNFIMQQKIKNI